MFRSIIYKTFGLRDGELHISFLMQLYIFLIITVLLIVKPTISALFLSRLGAENLPYGYLLVAGVAVVTSYFYNKAIRKFSLIKVTVVSLVFFSLSFILLAMLLHYSQLDNYWLYFYYLGVSLFAVITTSQFWILANMVYNAREAKRLFGFIGAGAIAGGIFGGYLTSIIVSSFGNVTVVIIAACLILFCVPILQRIYQLKIKKLNVYVRSQIKYDENNSHESSISILSKSRHLAYLAIITGIGVIVAKLVDYQFSDFANKNFASSDQLASFFGFWFSSFNLLALLLQLFLTNRILSKFGVSSTLLILPLGIALGSLLFLTFPELWVLVIIKGVDGSFKQSLNKAAFELSIMPIPLNIKNQAKSYIDVVVDSIATGISGFILILLTRKLNLSTSYITTIVLFFVFIWIILIYKLREAYFNSFRTNIQNTLPREELINDKGKTKETSLSASRRILNGANEQAILNLLDLMSSYKSKALKTSIINLLNFPSNKVKVEAIKQFHMYDRGTALSKVEALVNEKDDELVFTALYYIIDHSSTSEDDFFNKYLDHKSDYIANAALLCLAKETSDSDYLSSKYNLNERIDKKIKKLNHSANAVRKETIAELLITIAHSGIEKHYYFINKQLKSNDNYIVSHAIKAAGITYHHHFIKQLLEFLSQKKFRKRTIKALRNYGPEISNTLLNLDKSENLKDKTKRHIPKVVESFKTQNAVAVLMRLVKSRDVVIRFEATRSLNKLKSRNSKLFFNKRILKKLIIRESTYYKNTLISLISLNKINQRRTLTYSNNSINDPTITARQNVIDVLEDQLDFSLKCIFKLLSLIYEESDIRVSYSGLLSDIIETRINAIEFLDNLLQNQLKQRILPLLEYHIIDDKANYSNLKLKHLNERACLSLLLKTRGKRIKIEILNLINTLKDKKYLALIGSLKSHHNLEVKYLALKTFESMKR